MYSQTIKAANVQGTTGRGERMTRKIINYSQLWMEEEELLRRTAAALPAEATVVEIGTAQGGSARIDLTPQFLPV